MSTRINHGRIIRNCTLTEMLERLKTIRPRCVELAQSAIAKEIARRALNLQLTDRTGGALYFHQRNVTPGWAAEYTKTVEIGEFIFYKPRGGEAR